MRVVLLIGRLLYGGFFLYSGINHFVMRQQMAAYAQMHGVPGFMVAISGALIILGGLHVLFGVLPRLGLGFIVLFLVPVTLIMHAFWADTDPQTKMMDLTNFIKNLALIGGALSMMALPLPWPISLDLRQGRVPGIGRPLPH